MDGLAMVSKTENAQRDADDVLAKASASLCLVGFEQQYGVECGMICQEDQCLPVGHGIREELQLRKRRYDLRKDLVDDGHTVEAAQHGNGLAMCVENSFVENIGHEVSDGWRHQKAAHHDCGKCHNGQAQNGTPRLCRHDSMVEFDGDGDGDGMK